MADYGQSWLGMEEGASPAPPTREMYGLLVEAINDGLALVDDQCVFSYVNGRCCQMLGYSREEVVGHMITEFLDAASQGILLAQKSRRERGLHESFDLAWTNRNGRKVYTSIFNIPFLDGAGQAKGSLFVLTDITKRKQAEEALKKSEANLWAIFNSSLQYFVLLDRDKCIQAYNRVAKQRAKKFLGLDMQIGDSMLKFVVGEALDDFNRFFALALEGQSTTREFRLKTFSGSHYWVEANLNPVFTDDNRVSGVCFSLIDINERKQAEEAVRESEERYRLLVEGSPDAILIVSDLKIVYVNQMCIKLLGGAEGESIIGKSILDYVLPEDREEIGRCTLELVEKGRIQPLADRKLVRVDGTLMDVEVAAIPFIYRERPAVQLIVRDISQRKQAEEALLNYQEQLRCLASECSLSEEQERRRIATELHDRLGTTLSLAKIKLEGLPLTGTPGHLSQELSKIYELIERALADARSLTLELSPPVLYELGLKAGLEWLADQIQERHNLAVELVDDGQAWPVDEDVRGVMFRAVRELLVNVVKHARTDKATVSIRGNNGLLEIEVEDQGVGFNTSSLAPGRGRTGGFGLFSLRERLNHLGGRVEVDSLPGLGTRVKLLAPVKKETAA